MIRQRQLRHNHRQRHLHPSDHQHRDKAAVLAAKLRYAARDFWECLDSSDLSIFVLQVSRIRSCAGDDLFDKLEKNQTISRQILRESVSLTVCSLGPRFPCALLFAIMYPIIQRVVVERRIAGIEPR